MYDWARVGVRVICIDTRLINPKWHGDTLPTVGTEYTVRSVRVSKRGTVAITLFEIINPTSPRGHEYDFRAARFRPVAHKPAAAPSIEENA
jgi:hypothetical protein